MSVFDNDREKRTEVETGNKFGFDRSQFQKSYSSKEKLADMELNTRI